MSEDK